MTQWQDKENPGMGQNEFFQKSENPSTKTFVICLCMTVIIMIAAAWFFARYLQISKNPHEYKDVNNGVNLVTSFAFTIVGCGTGLLAYRHSKTWWQTALTSMSCLIIVAVIFVFFMLGNTVPPLPDTSDKNISHDA